MIYSGKDNLVSLNEYFGKLLPLNTNSLSGFIFISSANIILIEMSSARSILYKF
jgi:hypothetical protein